MFARQRSRLDRVAPVRWLARKHITSRVLVALLLGLPFAAAAEAHTAPLRAVQDPGDQLWVSRFNSQTNGYDAAFGLAISPDGTKLFVTGQTRRPGGDDDYGTVAYDAATGQEIWARRYDSGGPDYASDIAVSPDGSIVFVTGQTRPPGGDDDYGTVAFDAETGDRLWANVFNRPQRGSDDHPSALGVSPDGATVFVTGWSVGARTGADYATVAYDATTGSHLWVGRYNGPGDKDDRAHGLGISPDGATVYVTGESLGSGTDYDYATIAYWA
jgi:DNA-binding beta-propeller fold protein YncE